MAALAWACPATALAKPNVRVRVSMKSPPLQEFLYQDCNHQQGCDPSALEVMLRDSARKALEKLRVYQFTNELTPPPAFDLEIQLVPGKNSYPQAGVYATFTLHHGDEQVSSWPPPAPVLPAAPERPATLVHDAANRFPWLTNFITDLIADTEAPLFDKIFKAIPLSTQNKGKLTPSGVETPITYANLDLDVFSEDQIVFGVPIPGLGWQRVRSCDVQRLAGLLTKDDASPCAKLKSSPIPWPDPKPGRIDQVFLLHFVPK